MSAADRASYLNVLFVPALCGAIGLGLGVIVALCVYG